MARGDKPYFRVEVAFVEGPEFRRLSPEALKIYWFLNARCLETRRITLHQIDHSYIGGHTGLSHQRVAVGLAELGACPYGEAGLRLIYLEPNSNLLSIKVEGIDRNNPKILFSDSPYRPHIPPITSPLSEVKRREEKYGEETGKEELEKEPLSGIPLQAQGSQPHTSLPESPASPAPPATKKPEPVKRERKKPTGPHAEAIDYYCTRHEEIFHVPYKFAAGRDGQIVKDLLATYGLVAFKRIVDAYLIDRDEWLRGKGRPLTLLVHRVNRYAVEAAKKPEPSPEVSAEARELAERNRAVVAGMYGKGDE